MAVNVNVYVEDPVTQLLTYTEFILYRDTSPSGSFSTQVGTAQLVGGDAPVYVYNVTDASGDATYLYRYKLYNPSSGAASPLSEIAYPQGTTLANLRAGAARAASAGWTGTCSANGSTTTIVDLVLTDSGVSTQFGQGLWIYRPNAALASDMQRRVAQGGFNATTGTFTVTRAWTNAPASGETYQAFAYYPPVGGAGTPMSWNLIVQNALREAPFVQQVNIGQGDPPLRRFSLNALAGFVREPDIQRVIRRYIDAQGITFDFDCDRNARRWYCVETAPGELAIDIWPPPLANETVIVEVRRTDHNLFQDDDLTMCPYQYAIRAIAWQLYTQLNIQEPGKYASEEQQSQRIFERELRRYRPAGVIRGV